MKIEHVAFNVSDPQATAAWYAEHLGFKIVRAVETAPFAHFLADDSGTVMIEIYGNEDARIPVYSAMNPLVLHLALVTHDMDADRSRLIAAGAEAVGDVQTTPAGDRLAMLRDPWGFAVQLCERTVPMI